VSIDGGAEAERGVDADAADEPEARQQRPDDRPGRVGGVEEADALAEAGRAQQRRLDDDRQRRAHQRRRQDEHGEAEQEAHDGERAKRVRHERETESRPCLGRVC